MSVQVIGWDTTEDCCLKQIQGYNCGLNRSSTMHYCYTANVGGTIKYLIVDGYYANVTMYKTIAEHYDKEKIPNKPCSVKVYPEIVKEAKT